MLSFILFAYPIVVWVFLLRMRSVNKWRSRLLDAVSRDLKLRIFTNAEQVSPSHIDEMYNACDAASYWKLVFSPKPFRKHFEGSLLDKYSILDDMED